MAFGFGVGAAEVVASVRKRYEDGWREQVAREKERKEFMVR